MTLDVVHCAMIARDLCRILSNALQAVRQWNAVSKRTLDKIIYSY